MKPAHKRCFKAVIALLLALLLCTTVSGASRYKLGSEYTAGEQFMSIRLLGTLSIPDDAVNSIKVNELSGLAWDEDEQLLYALSNRGKLYHLKPEFHEGLLVNVRVIAAFKLRNRYGKKLKKPFRDAEGLALQQGSNGKKGDSRLLISFERKPRVAVFDNNGHELKQLPLPRPLNDTASYESDNHGLEALTVHPQFGVITTPEIPLPATKGTTLYNLAGKQWAISRFPVPDNAIVGMETMPDGALLLLERSFSSIFSPIVISLHKVQLGDECLQTPARKPHKVCQTEPLGIFSSSEGWDIDNFEGLAHHQGNRYFMVSDNNRFWLQRTLLSYFEVMPHVESAQESTVPNW